MLIAGFRLRLYPAYDGLQALRGLPSDVGRVERSETRRTIFLNLQSLVLIAGFRLRLYPAYDGSKGHAQAAI